MDKSEPGPLRCLDYIERAIVHELGGRGVDDQHRTAALAHDLVALPRLIESEAELGLLRYEPEAQIRGIGIGSLGEDPHQHVVEFGSGGGCDV
jgi:hypothetical protein